MFEMNSRRDLLLAMTSLLAGAASAQPFPGGWPNQPIKLIVPNAAGSATDVVGRAVMELVGKRFNATFVVDNRPGANGMLGTEVAAKAPKDGHTLLFTYAAAHVVNQSLYAKVGYDGARDFAPIAQISAGGNLLVVPTAHPAKTMKEFLAWARSKPADEIAYGSWGIGSGGHLSMEAVLQQTGLKMRHIPYKSAPAALNDLVAGHIQVSFGAVASSLPLMQGGKLRALAYSAPSRTSVLPDVPTLNEQGVNFDLTAWFGLFAPAGTPKAIVDALNAEVVRVLHAPEHQARWAAIGLGDRPKHTPEQFGEIVRSDIKAWGDVVRASGIKVE